MDKNKKLSLCLALCLAVSIFVAVILIACNSVYSPLDHSEQAGYYVAIDVNPSIELVVDAKGNVISAGGANKDAQVMLYQEDGIVGVNVNVAVENIAELAVKYGYLQDGQTVSVEVAGEKKGAQALEKQIGARFVNSVKSFAPEISVSVAKNPSLTLSEELEQLKAQYPDNEKIDSLSDVEYRLVKRVLENDPTMSLEDALSLDFEHALAKVKALHSGAIGKYGTAYKRLTDSANYAYDSAKQTLDGGLFSAYLASKAIKSVDFSEKLEYAERTMHALTYLSAKSYALALTYYKSCYDFFKAEPIYELTLDELTQIADAFGVSTEEFMSKVHADEKDGAYAVEKDELNAFVDYLFRNADEKDKQTIKTAYKELNAAISAKTNYKTLSAAAESVNKVFDDTKNSITQDVLAMFAQLAALPFGSRFDVDETINACKPEDLNYCDESAVEKAIAALDETAKTAYEKMAITEEEIEEMNQSTFAKLAKSKLNDAWNTLNSIVENAKADVQRLFSQEKENRKTA